MLRVDSKFFHHFRSRRAQAEAVQADHLSVETDILIPDIGDAGFDRDAFATLIRQDFFAIFVRFAVETFRCMASKQRARSSPSSLAAASACCSSLPHDRMIRFQLARSRVWRCSRRGALLRVGASRRSRSKSEPPVSLRRARLGRLFFPAAATNAPAVSSGSAGRITSICGITRTLATVSTGS